jgi:hypothetical protein
MSDNKEITLGQLIDGTEEEFNAHLSDKDLGYVKSLYGLLTATYDQMKTMKEDLKNKLMTTYNPACVPTEEERAIHDTIQGLFVKLMKVELLAMILVNEIKERESND